MYPSIYIYLSRRQTDIDRQLDGIPDGCKNESAMEKNKAKEDNVIDLRINETS